MFSHFLRKLGAIRTAGGGTRAVRVGGRRWHLTPDAAAVLGPGGPDLDRWLADGTAVVVKTGPHRTVYRVALPGGTVYVKHCRITGPRAWAREVLRPAKARLEFENALTLQSRGIAAVVPLAWGCPDTPWPGESFLITRSHDEAAPFLTLLERGMSPAVRRQLARALGEFFARLHDAGVAHPDPHPGNLLVELSPARPPRFSLIDLHAVGTGRPLSRAASRANLVLFNRWFQLRVGRADRLRFWHSYRRARRSLPLLGATQSAAAARAVERGTAASNLRFWAGRVSRCLGSNRHFRRVKAGSLRGFAVRDLPESVLRDLLADPDGAFTRPGVRTLKDSRTSTVAEFVIHTPAGPLPVVLKRVNVRHRVEPLKNLLRPSPMRRSWVHGHALRDRWLPTPRPLAVFHRYRHGLPAEGYLLTEKVPAAVGLPEAVAGDTSQLREWATRLARTIRQMHDRGVSHRDLKAANVMLSGPDPVLIDLVGVRLGKPVRLRQRAKELARLNASFLASVGGGKQNPSPGPSPEKGGEEDSRHPLAPPSFSGKGVGGLGSSFVTRTEKLRFLRAYLAAGENLERDWKSWWAVVSRATAAKVAKNRRTGRELA